MYRCTSCGRYYDSLPLIRQPHDYGETVVYETLPDRTCRACTGDLEVSAEDDPGENCGGFYPEEGD